MNAYSQSCCVRCDLMALTFMQINAPNCSCGWSTSTLVGRIYVRVYARAETWLHTKQYQRVHKFIFINNTLFYREKNKNKQIPNFSADSVRCVFISCGFLWTASSTECPMQLWSQFWKIKNVTNIHIFFKFN